MNKKQWKGEAETLRLILDSYNQTLPELHQKMYDARIEIKELKEVNEKCFAEEIELRLAVKLLEAAGGFGARMAKGVDEYVLTGKLPETENEELVRLRLIVVEKGNEIQKLQAIEQMWCRENRRLETIVKNWQERGEELEKEIEKIIQLENRELELLSEINDLKSMLAEAKVVINDLEKRNEELEQVPTISRYTDNH